MNALGCYFAVLLGQVAHCASVKNEKEEEDDDDDEDEDGDDTLEPTAIASLPEVLGTAWGEPILCCIPCKL